MRTLPYRFAQPADQGTRQTNGAALNAPANTKNTNSTRAAGQQPTDYARCTKRYRELVDEHCRPDNNRNRELDRALEILKRTCECGNDKMLLPDGKLTDQYQECQEIDGQGRRRRRRAG